MHFTLTTGQRHDTVAFPELVNPANVKVRDEVALNIAAATLWQTKLIVAARFGNSYGRLVQLLSSPNVVVRNDVGA